MAKNLTRIDFDVEMRRAELAQVISEILPLSPSYVVSDIRVHGARYVYEWRDFRISAPRSPLVRNSGTPGGKKKLDK